MQDKDTYPDVARLAEMSSDTLKAWCEIDPLAAALVNKSPQPSVRSVMFFTRHMDCYRGGLVFDLDDSNQTNEG